MGEMVCVIAEVRGICLQDPQYEKVWEPLLGNESNLFNMLTHPISASRSQKPESYMVVLAWELC